MTSPGPWGSHVASPLLPHLYIGNNDNHLSFHWVDVRIWGEDVCDTVKHSALLKLADPGSKGRIRGSLSAQDAGQQASSPLHGKRTCGDCGWEVPRPPPPRSRLWSRTVPLSGPGPHRVWGKVSGTPGSLRIAVPGDRGCSENALPSSWPSYSACYFELTWGHTQLGAAKHGVKCKQKYRRSVPVDIPESLCTEWESGCAG